MKDYLSIGPCPCDETAKATGIDPFEEIYAQAKQFRDTLIEYFQPKHTTLAVKTFDHDFGSYAEVVVWYDVNDLNAVTEALAMECPPPTWDDYRDGARFDWSEVPELSVDS